MTLASVRAICLLLLFAGYIQSTWSADTEHVDDFTDPVIRSQFIYLTDPEPDPGTRTRQPQEKSINGEQRASTIVSRSAITSPTNGSNITAATTFNWSDEGANQYLFRVGTSGCYSSEIVNQFGVSAGTTSYDVVNLDTNVVYYASIWAQPSAGASYTARDCAVYNVDKDSDGIYNEIDAEPEVFNPARQFTVGGSTLTVAPTGRVSVLRIPPALYAELDAGNTSNLSILTNILYRFYEDSFDFIFITNDQDSAIASYSGQYSSIQNDIQGIGGNTFNRTAQWGSDNPANAQINDGRLQGAIHFPDYSSFSRGPGLHELAHRWGNRLISIPDNGSGSHWAFSSGGGQLGGWAPGTLSDLGNGQYQANNGRPGSNFFGLVANGGNGLPYSQIELYLMGLIPASQLPTMQYATNPQWVNRSSGIFSADSIVSVTPNQIVTMDGERVPDPVSSQKLFNVLNVIVTTSNVSTAKIGELDEESYRFGLAADEGTSTYNFWEATNGTGELNMRSGLSALKSTVAAGGIDLDPTVTDSDTEDFCFPVTAQNQSVSVVCL